MGSPEGEMDRQPAEVPHRVRLTSPFWLGKTEVTNAQFRRFRPAHDSGSHMGESLNGDAQPAARITFYDAADTYGNGRSEQLIAKAFRGRRDKIVIATKIGYDFYHHAGER